VTQAPDDLTQLFRLQAKESPDSVAVLGEDGRRWTYRQLEARADVIASELLALGAGPDALVGICVPRSADLVAAMLGVWYSGAAYVPLDPDYPADRVAYMVRDSGLDIALTTRSLTRQLPGTRTLIIDELLADEATTGAPPPSRSGAEGLAYVIYTSGSTGHPKGVEVTRGGVTNFLRSMRRLPGISRSDTLGAVTTLSFDIAVLELLLPLTVGGTTVVLDSETVTDGERLDAALQRFGATIMQATPATWRVLLEAGWVGPSGFRALCGGEALPGDLAEALVSRASEVWNMYGPTETTVWSTCYRLPTSGQPVLIGRPVDNTTVYVLDPAKRPVPPGVQGEIYIGGAGLARGYRNQPERTAEAFVPDPFSPEPGARMYRTGDLGRYASDGNLEHRGRADTQVKVRGFRIELGEIESALSRVPGVRQTAVAVDTARPDDPRIVAYIVPETHAAPSTSDLRQHLHRWLPGHMIPQHFMLLPELPLTPNRKVDRRRLPPVDRTAPDAAGANHLVQPRTPTEAAVAGVWSAVLGLEHVSADADFFELGGHSVLAIQVVTRLKRDLGAPLTLRHFFEASTVDRLAATVDRLLADAETVGDSSERMVF